MTQTHHERQLRSDPMGHLALAPWAPAWPDLESDADILDERAGDGTRRYYLLEWGARPTTPVAVARALDALEALETLVLPDLRRCTPYPPSPADDGAHAGLPPEALLAVGRTGRCYLVGEVEWSSGHRPSCGALWRTFSSREIGQFHAIWQHLKRR